jgi:tetratricopeptide (TPR) repeat protein
MRLLVPRETHLEMLARNIITECFIFLGRPASALKNYLATRPLCEQHRQRRTELQSEYLEALLLDSLGHTREAEKAFRSNIASRMEAEHYKDAFLTLLTRFELLFRRGEMDKAARACEEALETIRQAGVACHDQMEEFWRRLLAMVRAQQLTEVHLLAARHYLLRHWNAPSRHAPLEQVDRSQVAAARPVQAPVGRVLMPDAAHAGHEGDDYATALEHHDRALIAVGLAQCKGHFGGTARLLGISRTTLRAKINRYGLTAAFREAASEDDDAGLDLLLEEDWKALSWLRARAWWAELRLLSTSQQLARIKTVLALRTRELFEVILEEAVASAPSDPRRAEETASVAYVLAGLLPKTSCPVPVKHDLQGAAQWVAANCRRLMGDWQGSGAVCEAARSHLDRGTGEPSREARLLSIEASLATDSGQHEEALALLARASSLFRSIEDASGVAAIAVKEASALLTAGRHAEAISRAEDALRLLPPRDVRLELLPKSLITECLVFLGRPAEALRSLQAARPLYEQLRGLHTELRLTYLEALVLDSLGLERQAETVFHVNVAARMEAGLYKDAFLTLLTRIELRFRRGELDKATLACKEAIAVMSEASEDRHAQAIDLFRELQTLLDGGDLTASRLLEARHALLRCWATPAKPASAEPPSRQGRTFVAPEPPPAPARLAPGDYEAVTESYEREVVLAGLAQAKGSINEACRLLGISRNTLRERMSRYGLREPADPDPSKA